MKVTIDTKEDSYEDIQKVLHLLTNIIQQKEGNIQTNFAEQKASVDTTNLMSMFDAPTMPQKQVADTPPDFSSFLNLTKQQEKKEDLPKIEFY